MLTTATLISAIALGAFALPNNELQSRATISSDASCQKIYDTCKSQVGAASALEAWSHKSCVLAATCFGGQRPVDGLLASIFPGVTPPPTALKEHRVANTIFSSTPGSGVSLQNFIDAYYGQLSEVGGPFPPNADLVISYFSRVQTWTAFCGQTVPWFNFADYFQYSPSVSSPGCGGVSFSSVTPIPTTFLSSSVLSSVTLTASSSRSVSTVTLTASSSRSVTVTPTTSSSRSFTVTPTTSSSRSTVTPTTSSSRSVTVTPTTSSSRSVTVTPTTSSSKSVTDTAATSSSRSVTVTSTTSSSRSVTVTPTTSSTSATTSPTTAPISSDASCQKIYETCKAEVGAATANEAWKHKSCVLAATCFGGQRPVDGLLASVFGGSTPPTALKETRVASNIFSSTPGTGVSLQNFIDAYYGQLSAVGGPFPPNADLVISYFNRVQTWTAFCGQTVPWFNFADYFQYSPTVSSPGCT